MYTRPEVFTKLKSLVDVYNNYVFESVTNIDVDYFETVDHLRRPPTGVALSPVEPGTSWGHEWGSAWFCGQVSIPADAGDEPVYIRARTGGVEGFLWINGEPKGIFTDPQNTAPAIAPNHQHLLLTSGAAAGKTFDIAIEAYAGHDTPGSHPYQGGGQMDGPKSVPEKCRTFRGIELVRRHDNIMAFVMDLQVALELVKVLPDSSCRKGKLQSALADVLATIVQMPQHYERDYWLPAMESAHAILRPLLEMKNGGTQSRAGLIGHSHMDTAWHWPVKETIRKCARTFSNALSLMDQYSEYRFIQSSVLHAEFMREHYPQIFEAMKKRVAEGRWEPNGGSWVEFDANMTGGESMVRQFLRGQRFTREHFNYTADCFWLPDTFGYSAAIPQILHGVGINNFFTTKLSWGKYTTFPHDSFKWRGIDGSEILVHLNTGHCAPGPATLVNTLQGGALRHKDLTDRRLIAYGYGDGGGGPNYEMIETARRVTDLDGCPPSEHMTISAFMADLRENCPALPTWIGELYLEFHRGCLTQLHNIKRGNRKSECALREAEIMSFLTGNAQHREELERLWDVLMTNHFHDILPGTSIQTAHEKAVVDFDEVISCSTRLAGETAANATTGDPSAVVVWNSMSWPRETAVTLDNVPEGMLPSGDGITGQWIETLEEKKRLAVVGASIPAMGALELPLTDAEATPGKSPFCFEDGKLDTPFATVEFNEYGAIESFIDKESGRELRGDGAPLNTIYMGEDVPASWDNWDIDEDQERKMQPQTRMVSEEIVADGPVQFRIRRSYEIGPFSALQQDMVLYADSPRVDFETLVDWQDKHHFLKAGFDLALVTDTMRNEVQFGYVERPTHRNRDAERGKFEVCNQKWSALSENRFGVALLNDCKYGISCLNTDLRISLHKGGAHPDPRGDAGQHLMTYSLLPYSGPFSTARVVRPAYEMNNPPTVSPGALAQGIPSSLLSMDAENVIVEAVKPAADGSDAWILRLYEAERSGTTARVQFQQPVSGVHQVNLLEDEIKAVEVEDNAVSIDLHAFEIVSLKVCF